MKTVQQRVLAFLANPHPDFIIKDCEIAGDACKLIYPSKNFWDGWDDDNKYFRSMIARESDGYVLSLGFRKFMNYMEKPDFEPWDTNEVFTAHKKIDGSCLIVSVYKGEWVIRTRGTVTVEALGNGRELPILMAKYPKFFNDTSNADDNRSYLFEWTTPSNIICLREHSTPTLSFLKAIDHRTGDYCDMDDDFFAFYYGFERPTLFTFSNIKDCLNEVLEWKNSEGVVIAQGQTLKKIKSKYYLELHRMCAGVTSVKSIVDVYLSSPMAENNDVSEEAFYVFIENTKDFEIAERVKHMIPCVTEAYKDYLNLLDAVTLEVEKRRHMASKEFSVWVLDKYVHIERAMAFNIHKDKKMDDKMIRSFVLDKAREYEEKL